MSRVFVDEDGGQVLSREALRRKATISIAPVSLDDVFVELVGSKSEDDPAETVEEPKSEAILR